jgi:hypothetical protein
MSKDTYFGVFQRGHVFPHARHYFHALYTLTFAGEPVTIYKAPVLHNSVLRHAFTLAPQLKKLVLEADSEVVTLRCVEEAANSGYGNVFRPSWAPAAVRNSISDFCEV